MHRGALKEVTTVRLDGDDMLHAVDVELARWPRSFIGRDVHIQVLPFIALFVAQHPEPHESSTRRHQAPRDKATRGREYRGLRVAVAVALAQLNRLVPRAPRG